MAKRTPDNCKSLSVAGSRAQTELVNASDLQNQIQTMSRQSRVKDASITVLTKTIKF